MSYARINFERKQVNKVLTRCKNGKHSDKRKQAEKLNQRQLRDMAYGMDR